MNSETNISEFNGAVAFLQRLHVSQVFTSESRRNLDAFGWYMELYNFHSELAPLMTDKQEESLINELNELNNLVQTNMRENERKHTNQINPDLFKKLISLEIKYKKVMKESNLMTKLKDSAEFSLE